MSASLREKVMKILKDLETQKRQIIELKSENQSLRATRASGLIPEAGLSVKITEPDLTSRHEQSVLRVESFDVAVLTEGDYVSMDEFRLIVDKYERLSVEARENRIGLQKEVSDLQAVAQDLTALVENLRHENQGLRASVGYMDEIQVSMRKQIETLQVQEEGYQITVGNLKKELETGGEEARILGRRATELEELNRALRRELEEMEQRTLHVGREAELVRNLSAENAELAQKLELRVVAEGVEEQEQQQFLTNAGCEIMQGFHFVRPMPGAQLAQWLSADHSFGS